jgi:hypothetical protein
MTFITTHCLISQEHTFYLIKALFLLLPNLAFQFGVSNDAENQIRRFSEFRSLEAIQNSKFKMKKTYSSSVHFEASQVGIFFRTFSSQFNCTFSVLLFKIHFIKSQKSMTDQRPTWISFHGMHPIAGQSAKIADPDSGVWEISNKDGRLVIRPPDGLFLQAGLTNVIVSNGDGSWQVDGNPGQVLTVQYERGHFFPKFK